MTITGSKVWLEVKFVGVAALASLVQAHIMCRSCSTVSDYVRVTSFNLALYIFLWRGNAFIAEYLSRKISWVDFPVRRFMVGFITTVLYTFVAALFVIIVYDNWLDLNFGSNYRFTIIIVMAGTFVISLFLHSREFLASWRKAALDAERFQRESILARYENLKNRINPEFLFQSLLDLDKLVFDDEDKAAAFIKRLAEVYRYILDTRDKELVASSREQKFLQDYFFLLRVHYGNSLLIEMDTLPATALPPLAIQMIIESALGNVAFNADQPMRISVTSARGALILAHGDTFRDGKSREQYYELIDRIRAKYGFITTEQFTVTESEGRVMITFPGIKSEGDDGTD